MKLYDIYKPANTPYAALLDTTLDSAEQASAQLKTASANYRPAVQYPQNPLATGLRLLAELIDSGTVENKLRVGQVTLTGLGHAHAGAAAPGAAPDRSSATPSAPSGTTSSATATRTTCWS